MQSTGRRSRGFRKGLALLFCLFLWGCQPTVQPSAVPTPAILTVRATPSLQSLKSDFSECARTEGVGLILLSAASLETANANVELRWGAAQGTTGPSRYTAVIAQEDLVLAANPHLPLQTMTLADVKPLFYQVPGETSSGEFHIWTYPAGSDIQTIVDTLLQDGNPARKSYLAPDPQAMLEAIAQDQQAIGWLPRRWVDQRVKAIKIKDIDPNRLNLPILASSPAEPQGPLRGWLLCVQERLAKEGEGGH